MIELTFCAGSPSNAKKTQQSQCSPRKSCSLKSPKKNVKQAQEDTAKVTSSDPQNEDESEEESSGESDDESAEDSNHDGTDITSGGKRKAFLAV